MTSRVEVRLRAGPQARFRLALGVCAASLLVGGCGTRVDQLSSSPTPVSSGSKPVEPAGGRPAQIRPETPSPGLVTANPPQVGTGQALSGSPSLAGAGTAASSPRGRTTAAQRQDTSKPEKENPGAGKPAVGSSGSTVGAPAQPDAPPTPGDGPTVSADLAPVVVATVGNYSGIPGAVFSPAVTGLQAWAKSVNDGGGLGGHVLRLLVGDDAGDPARHRALVQDLVERQGVIAFIASYDPLTGSASVEYLNQKRVPTISGLLIDSWFGHSPMHFAIGPADDNYNYISVSSVAMQLKSGATKKVGIITAVEAESSKAAGQRWAFYAGQVGLSVVYNANASIAQPDFTAECLNARNAGADVLMLGMDGNSIRRIGASCARQGFRPQISAPVTAVDPTIIDDPNMQNFIGGSPVLPWFLYPEFATAMKRYAPSSKAGSVAAEAFVAGKLFERVAVSLPAKPTSAAVLEGLWSLQGDTIGNTTQPLRYERDKPNPQKRCWYNVAVADGRWVSPDNGRLHCG